jgi:ABC-type cobalamin/Fe3+-siderophores transport system ATPase subunit
MDNVAIDIRNAAVAFRENVALRGVNLKVNVGEFVGIIGPNGAGKTTLLTAVNGLGKLVAGEVSVMGKKLKSHNAHNLRKRVGYVAQMQNIDPRMPVSAWEMAMMGRYGIMGFFNNVRASDVTMVKEVLELVGMSHLAYRPVGHLSGGELQRLAIAHSLVREPEILLLDEPTNSLDWKAQSEIMQLVKFIHNLKHLTTLFVTHDISALPLVCSKMVLMKDGVIWKSGDTASILTDENLSELYNLPVSEVRRKRAEVTLAQ